MAYTIQLYIALSIFGIGLIYKIYGWFRFSIGIHKPGITPRARVRAALKGLFRVLFSRKILTLIKVLITDVLLQRHVLKQDALRWVMHMLMYAGFTFLFFAHALDKIIITSLFDPYFLTLNPFLMISGLMVMSGIIITCYRRSVLKASHLKTNAMDVYTLILLTVIILSGIAMESTKLTSYDAYDKLWYIHIETCLIGLACLPFSKLFHMFTTPLSLLANAVMDKKSNPANIMTRQVMELDACMHCCNCSNYCSVSSAFDGIGNENILPSERMKFLKKYITWKDIGEKGLKSIQEGVYLCTNCDRCTVICPAGINLRDLWFSVREEMIERRHPVPLMLTPFSVYRGLNRQQLGPIRYNRPLVRARKAVTESYTLLADTEAVIPLSAANSEFKKTVGLTAWTGTYAYCFSCENCSTVCPVVGNYTDPQKELDMLPHQIIRSIGMGLKDLAMGSRMLWSCLTCYQCQEHCPQGVKVTDIFYELKNLAASEAAHSSPPTGFDKFSAKGGI